MLASCMLQLCTRPLMSLMLALTVTGCGSSGLRGASFVILDTRSGERLEFTDFIDRIEDADVLFLGEQHDNVTCHELQHWTTLALAERRTIALSLEQFESDVQASLDSYLADDITEAAFLEESRPWSNYAEHYRPTVEWARTEGVAVIAANIPRPLARRIARGYWEELDVIGDVNSPWQLNTDEPAYRARFEEVMGNHGGTENADLDDWFAAQCVKDDRMAEAIASHLTRAGSDAPLVIHWCGRFHSDYRLGPVSRLAERRPALNILTVSMETTDDLSSDPSADTSSSADFVWWIRD